MTSFLSFEPGMNLERPRFFVLFDEWIERKDREAVSTRITYRYRDASNYNQSESIIVWGKMTFAEVEPYLDEGKYFIPEQVGLEDLQHRFGKKLTLDDHPWHELNEGDFEPTDDTPTHSMTAEELLERFQTVTWDEVAAGNALGIPY